MTAEQFRFFVLATAWSVTNMTDGRIEKEDLYLIPFASEDEPPALVKLGVWSITDTGWLISDFLSTQTSAAQLEASLLNRRKADAERQRKKYEKDKASQGQDDPSSREAHVRFEGKERQGKERQGKAFDEGTPTESRTAQTNPDYCAHPDCNDRLTDFYRREGIRFCFMHQEATAA